MGEFARVNLGRIRKGESNIFQGRILGNHGGVVGSTCGALPHFRRMGSVRLIAVGACRARAVNRTSWKSSPLGKGKSNMFQGRI